MREGSAPNFCPPTEEGITLTFQDEKGDQIDLEFLGLILHEGRRYGFFFLVEDQAIAQEVYEDFKQAAKDLYDFE